MDDFIEDSQEKKHLKFIQFIFFALQSKITNMTYLVIKCQIFVACRLSGERYMVVGIDKNCIWFHLLFICLHYLYIDLLIKVQIVSFICSLK